MRKRPAGPARSLKTEQVAAAFVPLLIIVLSVTGFVWAQQPVTVVVDGRSTAIRTQARTVSDVLAQANVQVSPRDVVTPPLDSHVQGGMTVLVRHAVPVSIRMGGEQVEVAVVGRTVADALIAAGIDPADNPAVDPSLSTPLTRDMTITAPDVFVRVERERKPVAFPTIVREVPSRPAGERAVVFAGRQGTSMRVWRTIVCGGTESDRVLTAEATVIPPRPRVIEVGTAGRIRHLLNVASRQTKAAEAPRGGRKWRVLCTGYTCGEPGVNHNTATGDRVRHGVVAVDPRLIPLGTRLYIPGYGYGVAADTGGMIKGDHVDLYFDTPAEMEAWGSRTLTIIVLD